MSSRYLHLFLSALIVLLAGCKTKGPSFDPYASDRPSVFSTVKLENPIDPTWLNAPTNFYTLGPGDVIQIEMIGEPQSTAQALVGPDGKIYYSILPGLSVWGSTLSEAKDLIESGMARFMKVKPEINVTLVNGASKQVWILGEVRGPGVYRLTTPLTVLGAVAAAQGFAITPGSSEDPVDLRLSFLLRNGQPVPIDFYSLIKKGDLTQNIYLMPDDFLFFRTAASKEIFVLGAVPVPNAVPYKPDASLVSVITSVGGPVEYAQLTQVAVIRGSLSEPAIAVVNFKKVLAGDQTDIRLEPGDIVYVPFSPFMKIERLAEQIVRQFVRTVAANEGVNAVAKNRQPISVAVPVGQ